MPTEILSAIIQVGGAVVIAMTGYYLGRRRQIFERNRQRVIETSVTQAELANPRRFGPLSVSADKSLITGQPTDKGTLERVESAYSYVIHVSNTGLEHLEKPEIDITLGDEAVIVEVTTDSDTIPDDKISEVRVNTKPNFRRVVPQYLNRGDTLRISVLSVKDISAKCDVRIGGLGIIHQKTSTTVNAEPSDRPSSKTIIIIAIIATLGTILAAVISVVGQILSQNYKP